MGHRHNRRRFRVRHRESNLRDDVVEAMTLVKDLDACEASAASYIAEHDSPIQPALNDPAYRCTIEELEEAQRRMFGGEVGDEVSLCAPMLGVLVSLFGDVDYDDP